MGEIMKHKINPASCEYWSRKSQSKPAKHCENKTIETLLSGKNTEDILVGIALAYSLPIKEFCRIMANRIFHHNPKKVHYFVKDNVLFAFSYMCGIRKDGIIHPHWIDITP